MTADQNWAADSAGLVSREEEGDSGSSHPLWRAYGRGPQRVWCQPCVSADARFHRRADARCRLHLARAATGGRQWVPEEDIWRSILAKKDGKPAAAGQYDGDGRPFVAIFSAAVMHKPNWRTVLIGSRSRRTTRIWSGPQL